MAEAFMSAAYHICPITTNYQFGRWTLTEIMERPYPLFLPPFPSPDTTYMFVLAGLGLYKLVENRCPDVVPGVHTLLLVLASIILLVVIGTVGH